MRPGSVRDQRKLPNPRSRQSVVLDPKTAFVFWAEVYDDSPNPIVQLSERAISARVPDVRGLQVVDLACGTGRLLLQLLRLAPETCVGVDSSNAMLQKARLKEGITGRLIKADVHELPLLSGSIDLVTFSLGLSYCRNLSLVAQELQRILRPGGRILATDFHPTALQSGWKRSFTIGTIHYDVSHYEYSPQDISLAFKHYFQLICTLDLHFGEPERTTFECAGKSSSFEELRKGPALILFNWEKPADMGHAGLIKAD